MYRYLIRPLLFLLPPEAAHHLVIFLLRWLPGIRFLFTLFQPPPGDRGIVLAGIKFPNRVGLAAGFDKNALMVREMGTLGFGFIEIGTVTPRPQPGNPKPRIFRLPKDHAIINRLGFNNRGVTAAARNLKRPTNVVVGGNIGKNKDTPLDVAMDDYTQCLETLYDYVDYFVVNVSSPNTPGLRSMQDVAPLRALLQELGTRARSRVQRKPIFLKIAPDLDEQQIDGIVNVVLETKTDGIVATNTTVSRNDLQSNNARVVAAGEGGLSGAPLATKSTTIISLLRQKLGPDFPIIGVGGIMSPEDAVTKLQAGADLVQVYTGLIYSGPGLVGKIRRHVARYEREMVQ